MSEWKTYRLDELGDIITGSTPSTKRPEYWDGLIPFYSPADFNSRVYCEHTEKTITEEALNVSRPIPANSVMFTCIGSIGKIAISRHRGITNQQINSVIVNNKADYKFFYYLVTHYANIFIQYAPQTTIPIINKKDFSSFAFDIPLSLSEQRKIAKILSTFDAVIEKTEQAIEKYKAIKQGMMQDLFTRGLDENGRLRPRYEDAPDLYQNTELGWLPKEWDVVKIGEFCDIKGGKRLPAGSEFAEGTTEFPYLRVTDMIAGGIDESNLVYVTADIEPKIKNYKISKDDIYVTIAGTLGNFGTIPDKLDQSQLTENAARLTGYDKSKYLRDFIKYQCNSSIIQSQISREIGVGGGVPKLAIFRIAKFCFSVPEYDEQYKIAAAIKTMEDKMSAEQSSLHKHIKLKSGLMQALLTGRKRVKITPPNLPLPQGEESDSVEVAK